jgi:AcrR family transcriptional regulator
MTDAAQRRTQGERRTEAERRLVAAAAELVGEIGPSRVTLANVGERAGYSRGLATHHFGSKGALMQRLVDTVTVQFREAIFEEAKRNPLLIRRWDWCTPTFGCCPTFDRSTARAWSSGRTR